MCKTPEYIFLFSLDLLHIDQGGNCPISGGFRSVRMWTMEGPLTSSLENKHYTSPNKMASPRIAVVGAGISGIATAVSIQDKCPNSKVTIIADKFSPDTTSDGAAGYMQPYLAPGTPKEDIERWFISTWNHVLALINSPDAGQAGVHFTSGYNVFKEKVPDPSWKHLVLGFRLATETEMKQLFPAFKHGWFFTTIICEGMRYIPFMTEKFLKNGGDLVQRKIGSFAELSGDYDIIVNCTGVHSRFLANDDSVVPVRGQVLKVHAPWVKVTNRYRGDKDGTDKHHIYPRQGDVTVGGTAQEGRWDTDVDPKDAKEIFDRACSVLPSLKDAKIMKHWVGLRPQRSKGIRIEAETLTYGTQKVKVVHNYGHGGCGITVHWGCAQDAAQLVQKEVSCMPAARL